MRAARRGRGHEVEHEVTVRDGVHRVLDDALEAELARHPLAVGVEVDAGQRPGPERQPRGGVGGRTGSAARRARGARSERAGGGPGRRAARAEGACSRASASRCACRPAATSAAISSFTWSHVVSVCARTNIATSVATWSLRERAVWSLPPTGPTISVRRRSIAMWTSSSSGWNSKRSASTSSLHGLEPLLERGHVLALDDPLAAEHPHVRERLLDVVRREAPVERDRAVERLEGRVLRF